MTVVFKREHEPGLMLKNLRFFNMSEARNEPPAALFMGAPGERA